MATYIPKETALKVVEKYGPMHGSHTGLAICIASEIAEIPAAGVTSVTRCKNCKFSHEDEHGRTCEGYWYELSEYAVPVKDDGFCSYGKPREKL